MQSYFTQPPQLILRKDPQRGDRWELSYTADICGEEKRFELHIKVAWDDKVWYHYRFFACDYALGDPKEMITQEDLETRLQAIRDNEVDELIDAKIEFAIRKYQVIRGIEITMRNALIRRWEAMCELVSPSITM